jgi:hypothetical protein
VHVVGHVVKSRRLVQKHNGRIRTAVAAARVRKIENAVERTAAATTPQTATASKRQRKLEKQRLAAAKEAMFTPGSGTNALGPSRGVCMCVCVRVCVCVCERVCVCGPYVWRECFGPGHAPGLPAAGQVEDVACDCSCGAMGMCWAGSGAAGGAAGAATEEYEMLEFKDQGFTRAKVLVLLPFRHAALQFVKTMIALFGFKVCPMSGSRGAAPAAPPPFSRPPPNTHLCLAWRCVVVSLRMAVAWGAPYLRPPHCPLRVQDVNGLPRFQEEFGSPEDLEEPEPSDFKQTFHGNIDGSAAFARYSHHRQFLLGRCVDGVCVCACRRSFPTASTLPLMVHRADEFKLGIAFSNKVCRITPLLLRRPSPIARDSPYPLPCFTCV